MSSSFGQFFITLTTYLRTATERKKDLFWLKVSEFQSTVAWIHCYSPMRQNIMAVAVSGKGTWSPHGSQKEDRDRE
jgi:hypothetical protein